MSNPNLPDFHNREEQIRTLVNDYYLQYGPISTCKLVSSLFDEETEAEKLADQLECVKDELFHTDIEKCDLSEEVSNLEETITEMEVKIDELENERDELLEEKGCLSDQNNDLYYENSDLLGEIDSLKEELEK